ncbi:MAG: TetR/AcrR family transcriptional regulator [Treponema sp.]|nr:TetR/AcrR family transcriptional regulator [Treponema sp.]
MEETEELLEDEDGKKKTVRIERILDVAFELFATRGIEPVTMNDIAQKAKIGVASLYRYFETKEILVVKTVTHAWSTRMEDVLPNLVKPKYTNADGYSQLKVIFELFIKLYEKQTAFLRFIYLFDAYAVKEKIPKEDMTNYESKILLVKQIISIAIQKGIEDGTINKKYGKTGDILYFTLIHTFFSAAQKLAISGNLLDMDSHMNGAKQLTLLSDILLEGLK